MIKLVMFLFVFGLASFLPLASAQNITILNGTINNLETLLDSKQYLNVFYLVFFLLALTGFMVAMFKFRKDQYGLVFAIASIIFAILTSLMLMVPSDIVYEASNSQITVEEISWPNGSKTYNSAIIQQQHIDPIIPYNNQLRLVMSAFFSVLAIFNALYGIMILTHKA